MLEQATDFDDESAALARLITPLTDAVLTQPTLFKQWTIEHIIGHLHFWNLAVDYALTDPPRFDALAHERLAARDSPLREFEARWLAQQQLSGRALVRAWQAQIAAMLPRFAAADPKARVKWVGPDMSVRSAMTARLMETWAHGQAIYDRLGVERIDTDRIRNIVVLGINTFGWAYKIRGLPVPDRMPGLRLRAPSGEIWQYNDPNDGQLIDGSATEFCQVVTQTRNIADTQLRVTGDIAHQWMSIAQAFAGGAHAPPAPGARYRQSAPKVAAP